MKLPEHPGMPPLYVIYDHPRDFPEEFVCRVWYGEIAELSPFATAGSLKEIREALPPGKVNLGRYDQDDPAICEVWI
jgi:hypothetical protein